MAFDLLDIQNDVYKYEANEGQMKEVTKIDSTFPLRKCEWMKLWVKGQKLDIYFKSSFETHSWYLVISCKLCSSSKTYSLYLILPWEWYKIV